MTVSIQVVLTRSEDYTACGPLGPGDITLPTAVDNAAILRSVLQDSDPDFSVDAGIITQLTFNWHTKTFSGNAGTGFSGAWGFAAEAQGWQYEDGNPSVGEYCYECGWVINGPDDAQAGTLLYYDPGTWDTTGDLPTPDSYDSITSGMIYTPDPGGSTWTGSKPGLILAQTVFVVGKSYGDLSFPLDRTKFIGLNTFA